MPILGVVKRFRAEAAGVPALYGRGTCGSGVGAGAAWRKMKIDIGPEHSRRPRRQRMRFFMSARLPSWLMKLIQQKERGLTARRTQFFLDEVCWL